jgi:hypothetical protein
MWKDNNKVDVKGMKCEGIFGIEITLDGLFSTSTETCP